MNYNQKEELVQFWNKQFNQSNNVMTEYLIIEFIEFIRSQTNYILDRQQTFYIGQVFKAHQFSLFKHHTTYQLEFIYFLEHFWLVGHKRQQLYQFRFQPQPQPKPESKLLKVKVYDQNQKLNCFYFNDKYIYDKQKDQVNRLDSRIVRVGSNSQCNNIFIENQYINQKHLIICQQGGQFYVQDIAKSNRARLKITKSKRQLISNDMIIQIGNKDKMAVYNIVPQLYPSNYQQNNVEDQIVLLNTDQYQFKSIDQVKEHKKLYDYKDENAKYIVDNERNLKIEFIDGDLTGKTFEVHILNKFQFLDKECIPDSTKTMTILQSQKDYLKKSKYFYRNTELFEDKGNDNYKLSNSVFFKYQFGKNFENINNVFVLDHYSVENEHLYIGYEREYGWIVKEVKDTRFGSFVYLANKSQYQQKQFSNVHKLGQKQSLFIEDLELKIQIKSKSDKFEKKVHQYKQKYSLD